MWAARRPLCGVRVRALRAWWWQCGSENAEHQYRRGASAVVVSSGDCAAVLDEGQGVLIWPPLSAREKGLKQTSSAASGISSVAFCKD